MVVAITVNAGSCSVRLALWAPEGPEPRLLVPMAYARGSASPFALAREMVDHRGVPFAKR